MPLFHSVTSTTKILDIWCRTTCGLETINQTIDSLNYVYNSMRFQIWRSAVFLNEPKVKILSLDAISVAQNKD